ncbi:hypothetical protein [Bordetella pseudohinzii]|uniref:Uncharacterized protein n=1 Tax=Bordetella pseudohinzii TaxID=1331258 RepID=A0A0M7HKW1_9BORD|nr:hypothetical protein [Bordetella pseudohinzii]ANY16082.1 hypothetical protein BBN53_09330 [Bordetella pseudohinzii]KXA78540.1 hypothetical protein AW878_12615 [Bordetella pseudohinzii]KXA78608.1 hypothetical protein AW877_11365 [Bordetella pseudohinzii]CUJ10965.1 Uncharacterised protein [Bordetella pseudohinzii]
MRRFILLASLALGSAHAQTLVAQTGYPVTPDQRQAPPAGYQMPRTPSYGGSAAPGGQPAPAPVTLPGDPPQWQREDRTPAEKKRTARKEADAAYAEARKACRAQPPAERKACEAGARKQYQDDLAAIGRP